MVQTGGQPDVYGADQLRLQRNPVPKQTNIRLRKAQSLRGWTVCSSVVEHLPGKCEALGSASGSAQ